MRYVTVESVRRTCGIGSSEISDADVESIIDECEYQVERFFNTSFTPKEIIEVREGNDTNRMVLRNNPVLAVRDLKINNSTEDPANLDISKGSGKIKLNSNASNSIFVSSTYKIIVKYIYGFLEESSTSTTIDTDSTAGTSIALSVSSETGFSEDDWIEIYGMDGHREAAQITATDTGEITVDQLVQTHESGSTVVKLQISEIFKKLMNYACAIAMVARIVGQSYTDTVGYGLGELNVQKGEPYTQWRETASQLIKERDRLMSAIKPRPAIM